MAQTNDGEAMRGIVKPGASGRGYRPRGKNYLVIIGIDQYQYCPPLYNAVKDAKDIAALLTSRYQFLPENLTELYNSQATQREISKKFRTLATGITADDTLLVYFSGHGEYDQTIDTGYWIPVDGRLGEIGTFISFDLINKFVKAIKSHHTFIIADSCYSGSIFSERNAAQAMDHLESIPSRWVLTAGRNEVVSDGKPGDNSPFADAILYRLGQNQEPRLAVSEFCNYIIRDVRNNANQLPRGASMHGVGDRGGEFMFRLKDYVDIPFEEKLPEKTVMERPAEVPVRSMESQPVPEPPRPVIPETFQSVAEVKRTLKLLVAEDEFESVFKVFAQVLDPDASLNDDLILIQGRYNNHKKSALQGTVSEERLKIERNQIRAALLGYTDQLNEIDLKKM